MNILICNDDGIESNGLKKIAEKFALKHNVLVVAPDKNWSACSHLLSINDAIEITEYKGIKGFIYPGMGKRLSLSEAEAPRFYFLI